MRFRVPLSTLWSCGCPTRLDSRYTFVFVPKYGWCALLDKTAQSTAYFYSGGGYRIRPDGGLWFYDDRKLLVDHDGKISTLKNPYDMNPDKFATKLAEISGGDTGLEARLKYLLGREYPDNYVRVVKMNGDTIYGYLHNDAKTDGKKPVLKIGHAAAIHQYQRGARQQGYTLLGG